MGSSPIMSAKEENTRACGFLRLPVRLGVKPWNRLLLQGFNSLSIRRVAQLAEQRSPKP